MKKTIPVFPQPTSCFKTLSSATASPVRKKTDVVQGKYSGAAAAEEAEKNCVAGENPEFAKEMGWPVKSPALLPGSLLPRTRIVAYYGNPLSKRMGALGQYETKDMILRLKAEAKRWSDAEPVNTGTAGTSSDRRGCPGRAGQGGKIPDDHAG